MNDGFVTELLRDSQTVFDRWFTTCLVYAGYELVSIKQTSNQRFEYTVLCPRSDFDELKREFNSGLMPIADARAFR
jgi:hypothetical protein